MRVANIPAEHRRQGTTTRQMLDAPRGALFIWPVSTLSYPKALACHLERQDLIIAGPSALFEGGRRWFSERLPGVVVDHACQIDGRDMEALGNIEARCIRPASASQ